MKVFDTKAQVKYFVQMFTVEGFGPVMGVNPLQEEQAGATLLATKVCELPSGDFYGVAPQSRKQFENALRTSQPIVFGASFLVGMGKDKLGQSAPIAVGTGGRICLDQPAWVAGRVTAYETAPQGGFYALNMFVNIVLQMEREASKIAVPDHVHAEAERGRFLVLPD